jgi:TonB family protein
LRKLSRCAFLAGLALFAASLVPQTPAPTARPDIMQGMTPYHCFPAPGNFAVIDSDTQGVDFCFYLKDAMTITRDAWIPLIPRDVDKPFYKRGEVLVAFTILPSGQVDPASLTIKQSSGDHALDRAAQGAIQSSVFNRLPSEYHGPGLTLNFRFYYNVENVSSGPTKAQMTPRLRGPGIFHIGYDHKICCSNNHPRP